MTDGVREYADLAKVDLSEYRSQLECLKRNRENVSPELLKTKYRKAYDQLKEKIKVMTDSIIWDIVTYDLLVDRSRSEEIFAKINTAISESDILQQISYAAFRHQDANQVLECVGQLRKIVHAAAETDSDMDDDVEKSIGKLMEVMDSIEAAEQKGEKIATCTCGGIVRFGRASINNHLHARCETCGFTIMQ